jgi:hypothetical protein
MKDYTELQRSDDKEFDKFINALYTHPLQDETTQKFRTDILENARQYAREHELKEEDVIMIPVGSFRNLPRPNSDFDYIMFVNRHEPSSSLEEDYPFDVKRATDVWKVMSFEHFEDKSLGLDRQDRQSLAKLFFSVLFTPDNYIYGNLKQMAKLRLKLCSYALTQVNLDELKYDLEQELSKSFKSFESRGIKSGEKTQRFTSALGSYQTHLDDKYPGKSVGERWRSAFLISRERIHIPDLASIQSSLVRNSGKVIVK